MGKQGPIEDGIKQAVKACNDKKVVYLADGFESELLGGEFASIQIRAKRMERNSCRIYSKEYIKGVNFEEKRRAKVRLFCFIKS